MDHPALWGSLHIKLPKSLKDQLEQEAARQRITRGKWLRTAISQHLKSRSSAAVQPEQAARSTSSTNSVTVTLTDAEMAALRQRAALRNLPSAKFVTLLVRAELGIALNPELQQPATKVAGLLAALLTELNPLIGQRTTLGRPSAADDLLQSLASDLEHVASMARSALRTRRDT